MAAASLKAGEKVGMLSDGGGLHLSIRLVAKTEAVAKYWVFRYVSPSTGKRRDKGLGSAADVTLAEARAAAEALRRQVREGLDPIDERIVEKARRIAGARNSATFEDAARACFSGRASGFKNEVHRKQWISSLEKHAFPKIGKVPVSKIDIQDVMAVLEPIWFEMPETAGRVRGRIAAAISYAVVTGMRPPGANPAQWSGNLDAVLPSKRKIKSVKHHTALPWRDVPNFLKLIRSRPAVAARALEFLILTSVRVSSVLGMRWSEIDIEQRVWVIPSDRLKGQKERPFRFRLPLSPQAIALLESMRPLAQGPNSHVFPGSIMGRGLSTGAIDALIDRLVGNELSPRCTAHGFRSSFRDWAAENEQDRDLSEMSLQHKIRGGSERAYWREDALDRRRPIMDQWGRYCAGLNN